MNHLCGNRTENKTAQRTKTSGSHYDLTSFDLVSNPADWLGDGTKFRTSVEL